MNDFHFKRYEKIIKIKNFAEYIDILMIKMPNV